MCWGAGVSWGSFVAFDALYAGAVFACWALYALYAGAGFSWGSFVAFRALGKGWASEDWNAVKVLT